MELSSRDLPLVALSRHSSQSFQGLEDFSSHCVDGAVAMLFIQASTHGLAPFPSSVI